MSRFESFLEEVTALQAELQSHVDRVRSLEGQVVASLRDGHMPSDFLPRRFRALAYREHQSYQSLLSKFHQRIDSFLSTHLHAIEPTEDLKTILKIRTALRYIRNAFVGEIPLRTVLTRLDGNLPA